MNNKFYCKYEKVGQDITTIPIQKICFFYAHRQFISGGLYYFYKLAEHISKTYNYKVYIVNYKEANFTKNYKEKNNCSKITFLNYEDEVDTFGDGKDTLFFVYTNMLPILIEKFKKVELGRILIINFNPESPQILVNHLNLHFPRNVFKFFKTINENNAMTFMDQECIDTAIKYTKVKFKENFIPAFIDKTPTYIPPTKIISENEYNIGIICRLDNDKIESVINLLNNTYKIKSDKKINVHIIGNGNARYNINEKKYRKNLNLIFTSYLYGENLTKYITTNIDIMFNFGLSALTSASMNIPTVIPIFEIKKHSKDKYYWLFDTKYQSLGAPEYLVDKYKIKTFKIKDMIDIIYNKKKKEYYGEQCYSYFIKNHSIESSVEKFLYYASNTSLTIQECLDNKNVKNLITSYDKIKKLGYDWDGYTLYNNFKLRNKILFYMYNYLNNKTRISLFETKLFSYLYLSLERCGLNCPIRKNHKIMYDRIYLIGENHSLTDFLKKHHLHYHLFKFNMSNINKNICYNILTNEFMKNFIESIKQEYQNIEKLNKSNKILIIISFDYDLNLEIIVSIAKSIRKLFLNKKVLIRVHINNTEVDELHKSAICQIYKYKNTNSEEIYNFLNDIELAKCSRITTND